jgi:hypothetical protein
VLIIHRQGIVFYKQGVLFEDSFLMHKKGKQGAMMSGNIFHIVYSTLHTFKAIDTTLIYMKQNKKQNLF